jgi:Uma2 family endonuclease
MQQERWISLEEYLELDRTSLDVKYEYVDGRIYAFYEDVLFSTESS